ERYRRQGMLLDGREYVLEPAKKFANAISVRKIVHKHGMTFGAGDNELQFLSDGEACCSGVDRFRGFENVFKHQFALAVKRGTKDGTITIQSISDEWAPVGSNRSVSEFEDLPVFSTKVTERFKINPDPIGKDGGATRHQFSPTGETVTYTAQAAELWITDGRSLTP